MSIIYNTPLFTQNVPPISPPNTIQGPGFSVDGAGNVVAQSLSVSGNGTIGGTLAAELSSFLIDAFGQVIIQTNTDGGIGFHVKDSLGDVLFEVFTPGVGRTARVICPNDTTRGLQVFGHSGTQSAAVFEVFGDNGITSVFRASRAGISAFGAATAAQQTGASAAGIAAVTDANAKAALSALQAALAAFGFITSPA